jgi:hypothetical protein
MLLPGRGTSKGWFPHLVPGGATHLQYADDTILLFQNERNNIVNVKFLLLCFELLSGLKINFLKSEVVVMGVEQGEQARVANALNCRVVSFPLTYLDFPISDRKLTIAD